MSENIKFLIDECTGSKVAEWLENEGYEVYSVFDKSRGISDEEIIQKASEEDWVLVTNDKDFGELVFKNAYEHCGVIFLRLNNERYLNKINCLEKLLSNHLDQIKNQFVVVTETTVRIVEQ